jgi:hypothetical protein
MPEQFCKDVDPFFKLNVIPGHLKHSPPTSEYVPAEHGRQLPLPSSEVVPGGHRKHIFDPIGENVPAEQTLQTVFELARCSNPYEPASHKLHNFWP